MVLSLRDTHQHISRQKKRMYTTTQTRILSTTCHF